MAVLNYLKIDQNLPVGDTASMLVVPAENQIFLLIFWSHHMFCRSCGKEVNEKAVACPGCGMPPYAGDARCQGCGGETKPKQVMCTNCGCQLTNASAMSVGTVRQGSGMTTGMAILWLLCCWPVGFVKLNQGLKGLAWLGICFVTGGFGSVAMIVDYFMCNNKANKVGSLGEWEWFPRD